MHEIYAIAEKAWDKDENDRTVKEEKLIALLNMDGQVKNGGFAQWVDNGYASKDFHTVRRALKEMSTQTTKTIDDLLIRLEPYIKYDANYEGFFGDYWSCCDEEDEPGRMTAESLDDCYYDLDNQLLDELVLLMTDKPLPAIEWETPKIQGQKGCYEYCSPTCSCERKKPRVKLVGLDGNAFSIIGRVTKALKGAGQTDLVEEFKEKAMNGDYNHLLVTAMEYCEVY